MKSLVVILMLWLKCFPFLLNASGEGGVGVSFTRVEMTAGDSGYKFSFELSESGTLQQMTATWDREERNVDIKIFEVLDRVYIRGVKISAPSSYSTGRQNHVIVVIPFNVRLAKLNGERWNQSDVIRIHFVDGKFDMWEKAIVDPISPTKWILSNYENDKMEGNGEEEGKHNPYALFEFGDSSP